MSTAPSAYIIAEMACSHDGNPEFARAIIDGAGAAGADAVQFQVWTREEIMAPEHEDFALLGRIQLSRDAWRDLAAYARERYPRLRIIACVYERGSMEFCESLEVDAYKLHAADLANPTLIRQVAGTGKRIDLSIGAATLDEIQRAVQWIRETSPSDIWLMYGYQNFPTPTDAIHLRYMAQLQQLFGLPVGYQDHSAGGSEAGFFLPAAALGMGVSILEKHITHDRAYQGADHHAALNPDEFARFVAMVREIEAALGNPAPRPFSSEEEKYRTYARKSIVAARDLPAGTRIALEDMRFMRASALGIPPDQAARLAGTTTTRDIPAFRLLHEDDLA